MADSPNNKTPLSGDVDRLVEEQRQIAEIGRILSSSLDLNEVYPRFAAQARALVGADRLVISTFSEDHSELIEGFIDGVQIEGSHPGVRHTARSDQVYNDHFRGQKPFLVRDEAFNDYKPDSPLEITRRDSGLTTLLLLPLAWQGQPYGVMSLRAFDPDAFDPHAIDIAKQIASQISGVIATANQYAELQRESREREQLQEVRNIVGSSLNIDEIFEAFAKQTRSLVPADRIILITTDHDGEQIGRHEDGIQITDPKSTPAREEIYQATAVNRTHFVLNGEEYENYVLAVPAEVTRYAAGLRAILSLPLVWRGDLVGSLTLRSKDPDAYNSRDIDVANQIATQIASAVHASNQFRLLQNESSRREQLAEIGRIVSSSLDLEEVFAAFAAAAEELIPFDRLAISMVDARSQQIYDAHVTGQKLAQGNWTGPYSLEESVVPAPVYEKHLVFVANAETLLELSKTDIADDNRIRIEAGLISAMFVPVVLQGTIVGTLVFRSRDADPYGAADMELSQQIAAHIAGVLASSRQRLLLQTESAERERLSDERARIAEIGRIVSSTLDLNEVFTRFAEEARALLPFDRIAIITLSDDGESVIDNLVGGIDSNTAPAGAVLPIDQNPLQKKALLGGTELVLNGEDYRKIAESHAAEKVRLDSGLHSVLMSPMLWQGEVTGVINFRSTLPDAYNDHHVSIAKQISAQVAGAIAVANQYALLEAESAGRRRLADEQSRIAEIGRIVGSTFNLDEVFPLVFDQARVLIPMDRVAIVLLNEDRTVLTDVQIEGWVPENSPESSENPFGFNAQQKVVIASGISLVINGDEDTRSDAEKEFEKYLLDDGLQSTLISPLRWQGDVIGVVSFRSTEPHPYEKHQIELAEQIAAQIADAVATSNQYHSLEESEANYRDLVESGHILVWRLDPEGRFEYANKALESVLGYSADEIIGTRYPEFQRDSDPEQTIERYKMRATNPETNSGETIYLTKSGAEVNLSYSSFTRFDADGNFLGVRGTALDVTAERSAQDAIKIQTAALEEASDAVVVLLPDTTIGYVNNAFVKQMGYTKEEVIGQPSRIMRTGESADITHENIWDIVREGRIWRGTIFSKKKDGTIFTVDASLNPVFAEDGSISSYVSIRRDVTERIQAEQDRQARAELDAQNQQLQEINDQRDEFFSSVSHELRTPLTAVTAFSDILSRNRDGNLTSSQLDQLDVIKRNSRSLINLIEDMLDMSRLSSESLRIDRHPIDLDEMIDSVVESLEPTVKERNQHLSFVSATNGVQLDADKGRLIQVLSNLVTNACKYSPDGTPIEIQTSSDGESIELRVVDTGYGMSAEDLRMLFMPFYRSERSEVQAQAGTGLGMTISKTLIELHDGEIGVESNPDEGTTVKVTLPGVIKS